MSKLKIGNYLDQVELGISSLIGFFLLIDQKIIVYLITLLAINTIVSWFIHGIKKPNRYFYPFAIFFFIYLIGLLFTDNMFLGFKDLETKMSFFILPFLYGTRNRGTGINFSWVVWSFVLGAIIFLSICLVEAYACFAVEAYAAPAGLVCLKLAADG